MEGVYFSYYFTRASSGESETYNNISSGRFVLNDINLNIYEGDYIAVIGANGSGKSTLLRHLNGLLTPSKGDVWVKNWNTKEKKHLREIRSTVGMVFQVPDEQIVSTVVEEEVAFGLENLGIPEPELSQRVESALEITGLGNLRKRPTHSLSGGQKQLLVLASILSMNPRCLVLDEPASMLDPFFKERVYNIVDKLQSEGVTLVFATHSMEEASHARRVLVLNQGKIVMEGEAEEILTREKELKEIGLDIPFYSKLSKRVSSGLSGFPSRIVSGSIFLHELDRYIEKNRIFHSIKLLKNEERNKIIKSRVKEKNISPLIEISDLFYTYFSGTPNEVKALKGVNFLLHPGEAVGIMGPTGSGKSTLLHHMNGLLRPQKGNVTILGVSLNNKNIDMRLIRQKIGLLFQNPEDQLFERYAGDDVAFAPLNMGHSLEEARKLVKEAMELVDLPFDCKDRLIGEFSHGEKRRLALAGVLAMKPQVLVLDEPTSGLDPGGREKLLNVLRRWYKDSDRSIVMVSHDMEDISMFCHRVYVLENGRISLEGSVSEVFPTGEELFTKGLLVSHFWELSNELGRRGLNISKNIFNVEEVAEELIRLLSGDV